MTIPSDDFDLFNYTPTASDIEAEMMQAKPRAEEEITISDFDKYMIQNIDKFDAYVKDNSSTSIYKLTKNGGALTYEGILDEQIKKIYLSFPNGTRKKKIENLIKKHPALISAQPLTLWLRISYYLKLYND